MTTSPCIRPPVSLPEVTEYHTATAYQDVDPERAFFFVVCTACAECDCFRRMSDGAKIGIGVGVAVGVVLVGIAGFRILKSSGRV